MSSVMSSSPLRMEHHLLGDTDSLPDNDDDGSSAASAQSLSSPLRSSHSSITSASAPSTPTALSYTPSHPAVARGKDRAKHSESENRRRTRLRHKFALLRGAAECTKSDRYNILCKAVDTLNAYAQRMREYEHERARLMTLIRTFKSSSSASPLDALMSLAHYPILTNLAALFVSIDGRALDANDEMSSVVGLNKSALLNAPLSSLLYAKPSADVGRIIKALVSGQCRTYNISVVVGNRSTGAARTMNMIMSSVFRECRVAFILAIFADNNTNMMINNNNGDGCAVVPPSRESVESSPPPPPPQSHFSALTLSPAPQTYHNGLPIPPINIPPIQVPPTSPPRLTPSRIHTRRRSNSLSSYQHADAPPLLPVVAVALEANTPSHRAPMSAPTTPTGQAHYRPYPQQYAQSPYQRR